MCDFAQHQDVVQLFKETSLKRNVIIGTYVELYSDSNVFNIFLREIEKGN